jgi:hypothetical protein
MMKRNRYAVAVLLAGLVLAVGACEDGLTEANQDPNAPTDVGPQFLLPQAIRAAVEQAFSAGQMLSHTAIWPQHAVQLQYPDEEEGQVRPDRMQAYWNTYFAGPLKDIQLVIEKGEAAQRPRVEAVGKIWKSWTFHLVTDLWGDVPYTEALRGEEGITTPAYDAQRDIYVGLLADLTAAAGMLPGSGEGFGTGDILYANDFEKWRRFANSLRMRLAMRLSEEDATTARTEFIAAYNAGGFQSNADNAMLQWAGAPYDNPLFEDWQGRDDHGISATMVETLKSLSDPRLQLYAEPAQSDGEYRGLGNGISEPPLSIASYSRIGDFWRADGAATPTALMTYAEVLFLQAEAAARGWITADAATLYRNAIIANMNQYDAWSPANGPTDAEITAYLALPAVQYSAATGVAQINLQKWIALYMNGSETWANWRRVGVPALTKGPDMGTPRIPVRFSYPDGEQSLNNANLQAAVTRQGGGLDLVTPVWWQK